MFIHKQQYTTKVFYVVIEMYLCHVSLLVQADFKSEIKVSVYRYKKKQQPSLLLNIIDGHHIKHFYKINYKLDYEILRII